MTSSVDDCGVFVAPHHPRLDHRVFYHALGMSNKDVHRSLKMGWPYADTSSSCGVLLRTALRLLDPQSPVRASLFGRDSSASTAGGVGASRRGQLLGVRVRVFVYRLDPARGGCGGWVRDAVLTALPPIMRATSSSSRDDDLNRDLGDSGARSGTESATDGATDDGTDDGTGPRQTAAFRRSACASDALWRAHCGVEDEMWLPPPSAFRLNDVVWRR